MKLKTLLVFVILISSFFSKKYIFFLLDRLEILVFEIPAIRNKWKVDYLVEFTLDMKSSVLRRYKLFILFLKYRRLPVRFKIDSDFVNYFLILLSHKEKKRKMIRHSLLRNKTNHPDLNGSPATGVEAWGKNNKKGRRISSWASSRNSVFPIPSSVQWKRARACVWAMQTTTLPLPSSARTAPHPPLRYPAICRPPRSSPLSCYSLQKGPHGSKRNETEPNRTKSRIESHSTRTAAPISDQRLSGRCGGGACGLCHYFARADVRVFVCVSWPRKCVTSLFGTMDASKTRDYPNPRDSAGLCSILFHW